MKSVVMVCLALMVVVLFVAPGNAACPFTNYGPYAKVTKYMTGKKTVHQMWECVIPEDIAPWGNAVCFYNQTGLEASRNICIFGDFIIEYPEDY